MGSPCHQLWPASMYMQDFEQIALTTAPLKPSLWLRYVDDTFVIWKHGDREMQSFLEYLNGQVQVQVILFCLENR